MNFEEQMMLILICGVISVLTRAIPFLVFRDEKNIPPTIGYIGRVLPLAIFGMLVVYCFKDVEFTGGYFGIPEVLATLFICAIHIWKRNMLLSMLCGMVSYFVLLWIIPMVL